MRYYGRRIGVLTAVLVLLFATNGCRVVLPLHSQPYAHAPRGGQYVPPHARSLRHHYRYFPEVEVYFDITSNLYFYLSDHVWLSVPLLPSHIRIDLNNFVAMELDGSKPYIYHQDTRKRYPPGLRKNKHRKQRDKRDTRGW